jgi:hypothetical protein
MGSVVVARRQECRGLGMLGENKQSATYVGKDGHRVELGERWERDIVQV